MAFYVDTSAAVKLVVSEQGSPAMGRWASKRAGMLWSSDLLRTELARAVRRAAPLRMARARAVVDGLRLLSLSVSTFERAASLEPVTLRSLDALHLAAALELGDGLEGFVTFDDRLAEAAGREGHSVRPRS